MAGFTNRAKYRLLEHLARGTALPTSFYLALVTNSAPPTADTENLGELVEIADGNGYTTGGVQLSRNSTDFDELVEDPVLDRAYAQLRDLVWTALGGSLPASGDGARWAVLLDNKPVLADREVWAFWDLGSDQVVTVGQQLLIEDCQLDAVES